MLHIDFNFMKSKIQSSVIIFGIAVAVTIIYVFALSTHQPMQKKLVKFRFDTLVTESCHRRIERKNWLHVRTFSASEIRDCILNIKNGTSRNIFYAGNSIIRNLMTDITEIINSQKHIDYAIYKKHCSRDGAGSYMKNCNFTSLVGGLQNNTVITINLESAQYFGDVNSWFSQSDIVVLMVGHHYLIEAGNNDTWISHFWNDFDIFLSQYKAWIQNSSHSMARHLTYITPTHICCYKISGILRQDFNTKLYNVTRAAAEKLYAAGASILDLGEIMSFQNEVSPFACPRWASPDCTHPSLLNANFIQMYVNGMCTDERPGDTLAVRQHFWIGA